jgi:hypothetical protein
MLLLQHLNEEMRLSYLAQELISIDRLSPQAWYIFVSFQKVVTMFDSFVIPVSQFYVFFQSRIVKLLELEHGLE